MSDLRIVLASGSPQRRELLERVGLRFEIRVSGTDEQTDGDPAAIVVENAVAKARAVEHPAGGELVVGCDTDVVLDGGIIGKPENETAARDYLTRLSGREHRVLSGLALAGPEPGRIRTGLAESTVRFRKLGPEEIDRYVASGEWRGRAGGYAIQGRGSALVAGVDGDIANVIGLPVGLLFDLAPELDQPAG